MHPMTFLIMTRRFQILHSRGHWPLILLWCRRNWRTRQSGHKRLIQFYSKPFLETNKKNKIQLLSNNFFVRRRFFLSSIYTLAIAVQHFPLEILVIRCLSSTLSIVNFGHSSETFVILFLAQINIIICKLFRFGQFSMKKFRTFLFFENYCNLRFPKWPNSRSNLVGFWNYYFQMKSTPYNPRIQSCRPESGVIPSCRYWGKYNFILLTTDTKRNTPHPGRRPVCAGYTIILMSDYIVCWWRFHLRLVISLYFHIINLFFLF